MGASRLETCASALKRFNPSGFGKKNRLCCDFLWGKFSLVFAVSGAIYVSLMFSLVMLDMSKNVEIAILTAKVRENFAPKKVATKSNLFFRNWTD